MSVVVALASLASFGAAATASTIEAEPGGAMTQASLGALTFRTTAVTVSCNVTLSGTFSTSIEDATGGSLYAIESGRTSGCSAGSSMTLLAPWQGLLDQEVEFEGGSTGVTMSTVAVSVTAAGLTCLYAGAVPTALQGAGAPALTRLVTILTNALSKVSGSALCPASGSFGGTLALAPQQAISVCRVPPTVEAVLPPGGGAYRGEAFEALPTIRFACRTRLRAVTVPVGSAFRVTDPNGVIGLTHRAGAAVQYKVSGRREGTFEVEDLITIETNKGDVTTTIRWRNP